MYMILLFHTHSNRKGQYLQPCHSTIKRYSQFKAGAIFGVLASLHVLTRIPQQLIQSCTPLVNKQFTPGLHSNLMTG